MNATEVLEPIDRDLLCLLELPEDLPEQLSIAEASELTGLTAHTLRYYERIGLLDVRRDAAGYRSYDERAMARIVFISRLRASGIRFPKTFEAHRDPRFFADRHITRRDGISHQCQMS